MVSQNQRKQTVRIIDVARLSHVSPSTVSRVLNNGVGFSERTRRQVFDAVEKTNYQVNSVAHTLRAGKSGMIGLLIPDITNPFFAEIVETVEGDLFDKHYSTIICNTARDEKKEFSYLQKLDSRMVDGLVLISGQSKSTSDKRFPDIPIVCVDRELKGSPSAVTVSSDHFLGGVLATHELIEKGTIPLIAMNSYESTSSELRLSGYYEALRQAGIPKSMGKVVRVNSGSFEERCHELAEIIGDIRQQSRSKAIGVFAVDDALALAVAGAGLQSGVAIPSELKIVGFDDVVFRQAKKSELTTIHQDVGRIAQVACESLIRLIEEPGVDLDRRITVPVRLERRSTT